MSEVGKIEVSLILDGADSFEKDAKRAAQSLGTITLDLDKYGASTRTAGTHTKSFLAKMRDYTIVFGGVHNAIQMATDAITSIPRSIVQSNALIERNKVLLAGLEKGVSSYAEAQQRASVEMKQVLSISKGMPYSIEAILDAYTKLRVGGIEGTTESIKGLLDTAAKSGATSEQLKHASIALQQMAGKGVISLEELRGQLGEAIPDAMNIMARAVGMDMPTMVKLISTGSLEAKSALSRFLHEMKMENDGAAYAMSQTWTGTIEMLKKNWEVLVTNNGDGSTMFTNLKGQLQEVNQLLKSNEAKRFMKDIDETLSSIISNSASVAKAAYDNINLITSALIGMFAGSKITAPIKSTYAIIRAEIDKTAKANTAARAKFAQEMVAMKAAASSAILATPNTSAALIANRAAAASAAASSRARTLSYGSMSGAEDEIRKEKAFYAAKMETYAATEMQILKEKELHAAKMAGYAAGERAIMQASNAASKVNALTGAANLLKGAVNGVANAFGGWQTIAVTAIVAVIAYTVQAINKQKELNAQLMKNKGYGATEEELGQARKNVEDYDAAKKNVEYWQSQYNQFGKNQGSVVFGGENAAIKSNLELAKQALATKEKSHALDLKILANAEESINQNQRQSGEARFDQDLNSKLLDIQRQRTAQYDLEIKKNEQIKDIKQKMAANDKAQLERDKSVNEDSIKTVETQLTSYQQQLESLSKSIDPSGRGFDLTKVPKEARNEYNQLQGAITKTKDKLTELHERAREKLDPVQLMNQDKKDKTAADPGARMDDNLDVQIAKLREKLAALKENRDVETKTAELEARIANGEYKGKSDAFLGGLRAKTKEYDTLNNQVKDFTKNQQEANTIIEAMQNHVVSLRKKLAKSEVDSNNPFMQWKKTSEGEKAALDERIEHLQQIGQYNEKAAAEARSASELIAQLDQNNASDMITEKDKEMTKALMTTRNAAKYQHEEELRNLEVLRLSIEKMEQSPNRDHMLGQIDEVRVKMEELYRRENDPFLKWLHSVETLRDGVENKLVDTFDGLFDSIAERIVDTTANFGEMVRSLADDLQKYVIKLLMINALKSAITGSGVGSLGNMFGGSDTSSGSSSWLTTSTGGYDASSNGYDIGYDIYQPTKTFANGGIMTPFGDVPLRKYANGGVATSPQLAVFGEGSMNEAYVPLPDGRSIPVTMNDNKSNIGVSVNVINQSGVPVDAEQSSSPRFDGENYIVDVVLSAMSRPGRLRSAVKGVK